MSIEIKHFLPYPPATIWAVVGSPGRVDWVPGVESCEFDDAQMFMEYSVVESTPPLQSHLASIKLNPSDSDAGQGTEFIWRTDVAPEEVAPFIKKGMRGSLALLEQILAAEHPA